MKNTCQTDWYLDIYFIFYIPTLMCLSKARIGKIKTSFILVLATLQEMVFQFTGTSYSAEKHLLFDPASVAAGEYDYSAK